MNSKKIDSAFHIMLSLEENNKRLDIVNALDELSKQNTNLLVGENIDNAFTMLLEDYPKRLFDVVYVLSDESGYDYGKIVKYLSFDNKNKLKNFAMNFHNTSYYEKKEQEKIRYKLEKKGKNYVIKENVDDLFE